MRGGCDNFGEGDLEMGQKQERKTIMLLKKFIRTSLHCGDGEKRVDLRIIQKEKSLFDDRLE